MGSEKRKKEKKEKKEKDKKEKKEKKEKKDKDKKKESEKKKKDNSKSRNRSKDKKKDDFPKAKPPQKQENRPFRFDSPPKDPLQNTPFMTNRDRILKEVSLGDYEAMMPNNPLLNPQASLEVLQAMTPLLQLQRLQELRAQADVKADRKLYVGNLPHTTQPKELQDFLNQTLLKMGVSSEHAGSICNCWIDTNGHFGFIEFRTPEEATQGFILREVIFKGHALKIGRPKSFLTQLAQANAQMMSEQPLNPLSSLKVNDKDPQSLRNFRPLRLVSRYVQIPTNILVIKNVLTLEDVEIILIHQVTIDEEYNDILEDVKEEGQKFGNVKNVLIPRPDNGRVYPGVGKIYVEYDKVQEARTARRYLNGRLYGDKTVECGYIRREKWDLRSFTELNDDMLMEKEELQRLEMMEQDRIRRALQEQQQK